MKRRWYQSPDITWQRAIALGAIPIALFTVISTHPAGEWLENRLSRPFEFRVRHWLKRDPILSPQIKFYMYDDFAFADHKRDLTLDDWMKVLKSFEAAKPAGVFIDAEFQEPGDRQNAARFVKTLKNLPFPVVVGAHVGDSEIPGKDRLSLSNPDYRFQSYELDKIPNKGGIPYGASRSIAAGFAHIGHIAYENNFFIDALYRVESKIAIPSSALFASKTRNIDGDRLILDSGSVMLSKGRFLVNHAEPESTYYPKTFSLQPVLKNALEGKPNTNLPPNAWVIIHPEMYTGGTDFRPTPFGTIAGMYTMAAAFNSVLTGQWIELTRFTPIVVFLFGIIGTLMGKLLSANPFRISLLLSSMSVVAVGLLSFTYFSIEIPWLLSSFSLIVASLVTFIDKTRTTENKAKRLRDALEGAIPNDHLETILKSPEILDLTPKARVITIMFIDIVGFSVVAEKLSPEKAFKYLKETMTRLGKTIHAHGGVVDKTMGDGMLCLFGFHYDNRPPTDTHALEALQCAIALQRENVLSNLVAWKRQEPLFPIRIGINTSAAYMGDLGSARKIDLTVIGHGVNYAKRLEAACDPNCILMGSTTRDLLNGIAPQLIRGGETRYVQIKHHTDLIEAYEIDPFIDDVETRNEAIQTYREFAGWDRKEARFPIPESREIEVSSSQGNGNLLNFSEGWLGVVLDKYLAVGVTVQLSIDGDTKELRKRLDSFGLVPLIAEVRWGRVEKEGRYVHGLLIKNLTEIQQKRLVTELQKILPKSGKLKAS